MKMNIEQINTRAKCAQLAHGNHMDFVERSAGIVYQAHDLGWKVAMMLNDPRSVRNAESLLGVYLRADFQPRTQLSKLIYGI